LFISGYKTVAASHPDALALNILSGIMFEGRSSRMNRVIVEEKELAIAVQGTNTFPAEKLQTLFVTYGLPSQGVSLEDLEAAIDIEFERIKNEPVTKEELESVVTRRRATLLRQLGNNNGLGNLLGSTEMSTGNWRTVFHNLDRMQELTPEDLQRVANTYFLKTQRTVGLLKTIEDDVASN
jgi:predicted Zn-dependent peptidase